MVHALALPEHLRLRADARVVDRGEEWAGEIRGITDTWTSTAFDNWKNFDAEKLTTTGEWVRLSDGRAQVFTRLLSSAEYEELCVAEASALVPGTRTEERADGNAEHTTTRHRDSPPESVVLRRDDCVQAGSAVCSSNFGQTISVSLCLSQKMGDIADGYSQGVTICYDAASRRMTQLSSLERRKVPACTDPHKHIDFGALEKTAVPIGEAP